MKYLTILLFSILLPLQLMSQCGAGTTVTLSTQTDVDNFISNYCTDFLGNLIIKDNNDGVDNIADLSPLTTLSSVGGDLVFSQNTTLQNIDGLSAITTIGGTLAISSNDLLTNLNGLSAITTLGGGLQISSNDLLPNLNGLPFFTTINSFLNISSNPNLTSINELSNLTNIGGNLQIINLPLLSDIDALSSVTSIGGNLSIRANDLLTNLNGLSAITTLGGGLQISSNDLLPNLNGLPFFTTINSFLSISNNPNLTSINELSSLTNIGGEIQISNNDLLTDINALSAISSIGGSLQISYNDLLNNISGIANINAVTISSQNGDDLRIFNNPLLSICEVQSVCDFLTLAATDPNLTSNIQNNAAGCQTEAEIIASCPAPCISPTFTLTQGANNCPTQEFFINVNITNLGSAGTVNITNNQGVSASNGVGTGTYSIGPFPANTTVQITVADAANASCNAVMSLTTPASCPCVMPSFTLFQGTNNCPVEQFFINVNITNLGSAATLNITNNQGVSATNGVGTGTYSIGPFAVNTAVNITVTDAANVSCNNTMSLTTPVLCPPSNDNCNSATTLNCGVTLSSQTTNGATSAVHSTGCSMSNYGVWYTFIGDGNETTVTATSTGYDLELAIASGSCGSLANVDCEDSAVNGDEAITFTTVNGTVYYVYVAHYNSASSSTGNFDISRTCAAGCNIASFSLSQGNNNCPTEAFFIDVNLTALGSAAAVNITNDGGAAAINNVSSTGTYSVGPFGLGVTVIINIADANDGTCNTANSLTTPGACPALSCNELILSEYVEGGGNNKYLEIYNPTASSISLDNYSLVKYVNGSASNPTILALTGETIAAGDIFVISNPAGASWSGTPDLYNSTVMSYNGNDPIALRKNGANIDLIGVIGSSSYFGQNVTLVRKTTIETPTATYNASQWTSFAQDTYTDLGMHTSNCASACTMEVTNTNDTGSGSLRDAITCANNNSGGETISFNIPGAGTHTIAIQSELPQLTSSFTIIDGTTQSGNLPMAGKIIIDQTALNNATNVALRIIGSNSEIYGLTFVNTNINFKHSALFYAEPSQGFILGAENKGNWFLGNKWQSAVFLKENIDGGYIQSNTFQSSTMEMETGITINSGSNNIWIGGSLLTERNHFYNCTQSGIWLRNNSNDNLIENNFFQDNVIGIYNNGDFLGSSNMGNDFTDNIFMCNDAAITNTANGNLGIQPPVINCSRRDFVGGTGEPNAVIQVYRTPDNCTNGICQGEEILYNVTCDASGNFEVTLTPGNYLSLGDVIIATQTSLNKGTSSFSTCATVTATCNGNFAVTNTIINQCHAITTLIISAAQGNNNQDVDILDGSGNILCTINANGNDLGSTTFDVYISSTNRQDGAGIEYMRRNITISPTNQPNTPVTVRFYYTQSEYDALVAADNTINDYTDIDFSKFGIVCANTFSGTGTFIPQTGSGLYGASGDVYIEADFASFSSVFANGQNAVLPVELTSFTARVQQKTVALHWQTASEINNKGWNIQQSTNGHSWRTIGWVTGKGDGGSDYTYIDSNPTSGISFYRLEQIDLDGTKVYSKIKSVQFDDKKQNIYPNPVTDMLRQTGFEKGAIFNFYNTLGKLVLTKEISGNEPIDLSGLYTGVYFLKVEEGAKMVSFRVFKE